MRLGDFDAAWAISDAVLRARDPVDCDRAGAPYHLRWVWDGSPFAGRDVLVRCYHGLGDTIQFARYLPPLAAQAKRVTVEVQPELAALLAASFPHLTFHPFDPAAPGPPRDCTLEIMELAHALRRRPESISFPYLSVPAGWTSRGSALLPWDRPTIGLCWQAGSWNPARSIPLETLVSAIRRPALRLVSLQYGDGVEGACSAPGMVDFRDKPTDAGFTAALLERVDLVVTVDTMVAHLAGALGRPTCLLLPAEADWRWLATGSLTPWYPTIRLFRQRQAGDWQAPLAALRQTIDAWLAAQPGGRLTPRTCKSSW